MSIRGFILSGVATVAISGAAFASETGLDRAYDKLVAANTSIHARKSDEAVRQLEAAAKDVPQAREADLRHDIDDVVVLLHSRDSATYARAAAAVQRAQDRAQAELMGKPHTPGN